MTDKERLEDIKTWLNRGFDLTEEDYEWLIKQTERVQSLEYYKKDWMLVVEQNKRYREALEFYALGRHWITSLKDGRDYVNEYGEVARKALEESE